MRTYTILAVALAFGPALSWAQEAPAVASPVETPAPAAGQAADDAAPPGDDAAADEGEAPGEDEAPVDGEAPGADAVPEEEEPPIPTLDVAPMPGANEDFTVDRELFKDVETDPEAELIREREQQDSLAETERPLYQRMPGLAILTEAVAGLFGAGAFGLLGGSIGEAIDPGDDGLPFGGVHGALIGGLVGSLIGATGGAWGAAQLFEKDLDFGWAALGAFLGTAVGGSIAFGLVEGIDGAGDGVEAIGVALLFVMQVGGAIGLSEAFLVDPVRRIGPAPVDSRLPGGDLGVRPLIMTIPVMRGEF